MTAPLADRVAVVTGGATGIGCHVAHLWGSAAEGLVRYIQDPKLREQT